MNTLIVIGWLGVRRAYLNVSREEAIRRYMEAEGEEDPPPPERITEFSFEDEFGCYDAYEG